MSKDECLRRLNNYRPQKPADLTKMMVHKEPYLAPVPIPMVADEQKPVEWSENFEKNIQILLHDKLTWHSEDGCVSSTVFIDDKTLKDIINGIWFYVGKEAMKNPNMELPKQEWSEEDEKMLQSIIKDFRAGKVSTIGQEQWLKSLRPSWKPSEEQMVALEAATVRYQSTGLESLFEDLKKLM